MVGCRQAVGAAQQEETAAAAEVEKLNKALQDVRGRVQQRRTDSQAQASQGALVRALMSAKSSKEIPGILGRLGENNNVVLSCSLDLGHMLCMFTNGPSSV